MDPRGTGRGPLQTVAHLWGFAGRTMIGIASFEASSVAWQHSGLVVSAHYGGSVFGE